MPSPSPSKSFALQQQIRQNASEMNSYYTDLQRWEQNIKKKDQSLRKQRANSSKSRPVRGAVTTKCRSTTGGGTTQQHPIDQLQSKISEPSAHVYDKGYEKWQKFDVDKALKDVDADLPDMKPAEQEETTLQPISSTIKRNMKGKPTIIDAKSRPEIEKQDGNEHYRKGDFVAAIKCYTRCLGYDMHNAIVLSNRAMCYLKTKEYQKALADCLLALKYDPKHVKSYARAATARNALGQHRNAFLDIQKALDLEPYNKQLLGEQRKTRELMKTAIKRVPKVDIHVEEIGQRDTKSIEPTKEARAEPKEEKEPSAAGSIQKATPPLQQSASVKLPSKVPKTSYEFQRVWSSLCNANATELKCQYLKRIRPENLSKLFKSSLESSTLISIVEATGHFNSITLCYEFLLHLSQVPRFNMITMLLSKSEQAEVAKVFEYLRSGSEISNDEIEQLEKKYEC